ncbi:MAG: type VI secretion system baseplate subunit TssF [Alphaproteobacteria bacterium]|nr:type VI secretion system baseplate subunit TssF [Alphaproteobacteria bacterium]
MADELLPYYERELAWLRSKAGEFADAHPKIAGSLRLTRDAVDDPHVSRLIESVAFLNARTRRKLDDDFPELTAGLLDVLYPHYLRPIPSMSMVRFEPLPDATEPVAIDVGTALETEPLNGLHCQYRTTQPVTLWPIKIESIRMGPYPGGAPEFPQASGCRAVLKLELRCQSDGASFGSLAPPFLRFHLRDETRAANALYERIHNQVACVALCTPKRRDRPIAILGADAIRPVGFGPDEAMLPYPVNSFPGYRLLTEYFTFPEKFLFFDLAGLDGATLAGVGPALDVYVYMAGPAGNLERTISVQSLALGCAPIVNLFRKIAEPIPLTHAADRYPIRGDLRRADAIEVYSVDEVTATSPRGETVRFLPFHAPTHRRDDTARYWLAHREPAGERDPATEVSLSFVDLSFRPEAPAGWVANVALTCCNRDLPRHLPFGGGHPHLRLLEGGSAIQAVECIRAPTPTLRPPMGHGLTWRLVSHLALNHLSLTSDHNGLDALREILALYDFRDNSETRAAAEGIVGLTARSGTARAPGPGAGAICRGTEVTLEFDEKKLADNGFFLLASVLERFVALYGSINSYTRLTAVARGRSEAVKTWPPRAGDKFLL